MQLTWQQDRATWQRLAAESPGGTLFHLPAWADAIAASDLGRPETLTATWPDGRQAMLILAVQPIWRGWSQAARCGAQGGYGGLLSNGPLTVEEQRAIYRELRRRFPDYSGNTNPFAAPLPPDAGLALQPAGDLRVLRLAPLDDLRVGYNQERRRAVRRYQKHNVVTSVRDRLDQDDLMLFWRLYQIEVATWKRQGRSLHLVDQRGWFEALWRALDGRLRMAVATVDGEVAGAVLYAGYRDWAHYLYCAWDRRFAAQGAVTALIEASMADCHARGHAVFDFMTSLGIAGIDWFKGSFGAEAIPIWEYGHHGPLTRLLTTSQRAIHQVRRVLSDVRRPVTPPTPETADTPSMTASQ